jgi:hypothetical protein
MRLIEVNGTGTASEERKRVQRPEQSRAPIRSKGKAGDAPVDWMCLLCVWAWPCQKAAEGCDCAHGERERLMLR